MPNILFTIEIFGQARRCLRNESQLFEAVVDIGGFHFESGIHDFPG